jgi:hypothetical protein
MKKAGEVNLALVELLKYVLSGDNGLIPDYRRAPSQYINEITNERQS